MSSPAESQPASPAPLRDSARLFAVCERWNRKLHFYTGLFLIVFLWLFAFTGLLLNHPNWTFHESWRNRHETKFQLPIEPPAAGLVGDLDQARDLMRQMSIDGEILWTTTRSDGAPFEFQVRTPRTRHFTSIASSAGNLIQDFSLIRIIRPSPPFGIPRNGPKVQEN